MKPFNLKEYLSNPSKKVVTRDGKNVRILCTDRKSDSKEVVGLIMNNDGTEGLLCWSKQGKSTSLSSLDLFFAPEKHEGWVSIYRRVIYDGYFTDGIYDSEEKAKERGGCIATVKIEWEE